MSGMVEGYPGSHGTILAIRIQKRRGAGILILNQDVQDI